MPPDNEDGDDDEDRISRDSSEAAVVLHHRPPPELIQHYYQPQGGHRSFNGYRSPPPPVAYVDLQIGNLLRSVHPSPMSSDQVVAVPSMFGSDLNFTTFWELRDELEPLLRVKYRNTLHDNVKGGWRLDAVQAGVILVVPQFQARPLRCDEDNQDGGGAPRFGLTCPALTGSPGCDDDDATAGASRVSAVTKVFLRICEYYSIHPGSAIVNAGIMFGRPAVKLRPAHSYVRRLFLPSSKGMLCNGPSRAHIVPRCFVCLFSCRSKCHSNNCFVVAAFGAPRRVVLHKRDNHASFLVSLPNNGAVAIMDGVSRDGGWLYGIENMGDEGATEGGLDRSSSSNGGNMTPNSRAETITLFVSGHCTKLRHFRPGAVLQRPPRRPSPQTITPLPPRHHSRRGGGGDLGGDDDDDCDPPERHSPVRPSCLPSEHGRSGRSRSRSRSRSSSPP
jgi:hypothetical protein